MAIKVNKFTTLTSTLAAGATAGTLTSAVFDNGTAVPLTLEYDNSAKIEKITADISGTALTNISRAKDGTADIEHTGTPKIGQGSDPETWKYWWNNKTDATMIGYAETTTNQTGITTQVDLTAGTPLATTVTVPAGGRMVEINVKASVQVASGSNTVVILRIKEGNTELNRALLVAPVALQSNTMMCQALITPTAGVHTYKATLEAGASTAVISDANGGKSYISVKLA